jgi:5-methylcytosine-specific restriction enzyme subunit McrC
LLCHYRAQTADLEENRILAWTLFSIARCPLSLERCQPIVRQAYHALEDMVTLHPYSAADCIGRRYDRLNADYAVLHALCRFFLEGMGPSHDKGVHLMVPFLVDMERLFELFVAQWLRRHLPTHIKLQEQQRVPLSGNGNLSFNIDLVLSDRASSRVLTVLDTKYKRSSQPSAEDVAQVVAYAQAQGCQEAVLVYPVPVHSVPVYRLPGTISDNAAFQRNAASAPTAGASQPITARVGNIRVRSLTFSLDADLERAGHSFIENLLA